MDNYGNSNFGHWTLDEFNLPAFVYTCNQIEDERAKYNVSGNRTRTTHWHQVGNNRITAIATNDGYLQLFCGKRDFKWINYYNPAFNNYAGGFGYLTEGKNHWNTFYLDKPINSNFERVFGISYYKKSLEYQEIKCTQTLFAPFGDDEIVISEIEISNMGSMERELSYYEYWDINFNIIGKQTEPFGILSTRFNPDFKTLFVTSDQKNADLIFLSAIGQTLISGFDTDKNSFFGNGGRVDPEHVKKNSCANSIVNLSKPSGGSEICLVIRSDIKIAPNHSRKLYYIFGYGTLDVIIQTIKKYEENKNPLKTSLEKWREEIPIFNSPTDKWIGRELAWGYYYTRSASFYSDFFSCHTITQGSNYQYIAGINGSIRDNAQHAMPMVYMYPDVARETIKFMCMSQNAKDGELSQGYTNERKWNNSLSFLSGFNKPTSVNASDLDLWFLWLVTEYSLATRDFNILKENVPYFNSTIEKTVYEHLKHAVDHLVNRVGTGAHNLIKVRTGDWNDIILFASFKNIPLTFLFGESVFNTVMAIWVLNYFAQLVDIVGDNNFAELVRSHSENYKKSVRKEFNGKWFNRGYFGIDKVLGGVDRIFLESNIWALISGSSTEEQTMEVVHYIQDMLDARSEIGSPICYPPFDKPMSKFWPQGQSENGGIWPSLLGPLTWAYKCIGFNDLAFSTYKKMMLAKHAETYPDIWFGVWSGPDTYNSFMSSEQEGKTLFSQTSNQILNKMDFPVMCTHVHAQPLYYILKIAGIQPSYEGFVVDPGFPYEEFSLETKLIGVSYRKDSCYGYYCGLNHCNSKIILQVKTPENLMGRKIGVKVNYNEVEYEESNAFLKFMIPVVEGEKTAWEIEPAT